MRSKAGHHAAKHGKARTQAVCAEKQFAHTHQQAGARDAQHAVGRSIPPAGQRARHPLGERRGQARAKDERKVVHTEKDILPACPVPQAVAQPHRKQRYRACEQRAEMPAQPAPCRTGQLFERA